MPTLSKTAGLSGGTATATKPAAASPTMPRTNGSSPAMGRTNGTNTATLDRPTGGSNMQALQYIAEMNTTIGQLERELQSHTDPTTMARDQVLLKSYFDQIVGRTWQIAQACRITWTPPQAGVSRNR